MIAALAGLLALAALILFAAQARPEVAGQPPGGTFVEGLAGVPMFINPVLAASQADRDASALIFAGLTRLDARGEIAPDLASTWDISPDGITYTFHLRPSARWHDGAPVTADDVLYTVGLLQRPDFMGDPALASPWWAVRVQKVDLGTVRFVLPEPYAAFLQYTRLGLLPAHQWRDTPPGELAASPLNLAPVGAGRFRLVPPAQTTPEPASPHAAHLPPDGILLEPSPYNQETPPLLGRIWLRYYPSPGALAEALERGEISACGGLDPALLARLRDNPQVQVVQADLAATEMIFLNTRLPLFDRRETRKALLLGLDRQALLDGIAGGQGRIADSPIQPGSWAYDAGLPREGYDPQEARRLLDQAGWTSTGAQARARDGRPLSFTLAVAEGDMVGQALARAVAEQWRRIGAQAVVRVVARDQLLDDLLGQRNFEAVLAGWRSPTNDPDVYQLWHSTQAPPGQGLNFSGYSDMAADEALERGRVTLDRAERTRQYAIFQRAFAEDVPSVLLYYPSYAYVVTSRANGVALPPRLLDPSGRFSLISSWSIGP